MIKISENIYEVSNHLGIIEDEIKKLRKQHGKKAKKRVEDLNELAMLDYNASHGHDSSEIKEKIKELIVEEFGEFFYKILILNLT